MPSANPKYGSTILCLKIHGIAILVLTAVLFPFAFAALPLRLLRTPIMAADEARHWLVIFSSLVGLWTIGSGLLLAIPFFRKAETEERAAQQARWVLVASCVIAFILQNILALSPTGSVMVLMLALPLLWYGPGRRKEVRCCSVCAHPNDPSHATCAHCGRPLPRKPSPVQDQENAAPAKIAQ